MSSVEVTRDKIATEVETIWRRELRVRVELLSQSPPERFGFLSNFVVCSPHSVTVAGFRIRAVVLFDWMSRFINRAYPKFDSAADRVAAVVLIG